MAASAAVTTAFFCWILYLALEPHVRRLWPETLIGWTRLVSGRVRDPLVGKDIALGVFAGVITAAVPHLVFLAFSEVGVRKVLPVGAVPLLMDVNSYMLGSRHALSIRFVAVAQSIGSAVPAVFALLLLTVLLRSRVRAAVAYAVVLPFLPLLGDNGTIAIVVQTGAIYVIGLFMILRFGMLAFAVSVFVWPLLVSVSFDTTAPYAATWMSVFAMIVGLALFGLSTALGSRSWLEFPLLRGVGSDVRG